MEARVSIREDEMYKNRSAFDHYGLDLQLVFSFVFEKGVWPDPE